MIIAVVVDAIMYCRLYELQHAGIYVVLFLAIYVQMISEMIQCQSRW